MPIRNKNVTKASCQGSMNYNNSEMRNFKGK